MSERFSRSFKTNRPFGGFALTLAPEERLIVPLLSNIDDDAIGPRLPDSTNAANKISLVHVDHRLVELIQTPPHEIPTSQSGRDSSNTRRVERLLGLPPSVYFYAGRACPDFGNTAFAFGPECEKDRDGSASPFDTGGLLSNPPHLMIDLSPHDDSEDQRVKFGQDSVLDLQEWRTTFGRFLAAFFRKNVDYWHERPSQTDPERLFELNSDWRTWTFEIRFSEGQSIHHRDAWCADGSVMSQLRRLDDQQPTGIPGDPPSALDQFFAGPPALEPQGTPDFCTRLEQWVREQIEA